MNRNIAVLIVVGLVSMGAGIGLFQLTDHQLEQYNVVKPASAPPSLSAIPLTRLDGSTQTLDDFREPILVVNFWAPWCIPCRREVPALIELQRQYQGKVQVLGLALDSVENIQEFANEHAMNYPSFIVGSKIPMYNAAFGNKSGALPFTAFVDQQRKVQEVHTGELTYEELQEKVSRIL